MYKVVVRIFYIIVNPIRTIYWFICRPETRGVKCVIENEGRFLLVKLSYSHKRWTVPGGGVNKNETLEEAIRREVFEEVGIKLGEIKKVGEYISTKEYKIDTITVFHALVPSLEFKIDGGEIIEAGWFERNNLPHDRSPKLEMFLSFISPA